MGIKHYCICFTLAAFSTWSLTTSAAITTKIVGGKASSANQWPWIVALSRKGNDNYQGQFCGGSVISPAWIVTAAHCLEKEKSANINVIYKVLNLKYDVGQVFTVKRIILHPKYNTKNHSNDIALIQLQKPITGVTVLPLVTGSSPLVGASAAIIGWGALSEFDSIHSIYPENLYDAVLPIISNAVCKQSPDGAQIVDTMLCAGASNANVDSCSGDSGGPLVIQQNKQWRLAGITSWGNGCANPGYYGVYTRVSKYVSYINGIMKINFIALADVNKDKVINSLDKTKKNNDLKAEFQTWVKQCWTTKKPCANINTDTVINQNDYLQRSKRVTTDFNTWRDLYWQPEIR
jgi:secreted trypsin-like serine protease